jgi:phage terminase small subunit
MTEDNKIKLTAKQQLFIKEYLIDFNATQAAIRAGYSAKNANRQANQNLSKLDIQNAIIETKKNRFERLEIDSDYVLKRLIEIDQLDIGDIVYDDGSIRPISEWPKVWRITISGIDVSTTSISEITTEVKKIKWPDKQRNIELIGKHMNIQAFKEAKTIEHSGQVQASYSDLSEAEIDARIAELELKLRD